MYVDRTESLAHLLPVDELGHAQHLAAKLHEQLVTDIKTSIQNYKGSGKMGLGHIHMAVKYSPIAKSGIETAGLTYEQANTVANKVLKSLEHSSSRIFGKSHLRFRKREWEQSAFVLFNSGPAISKTPHAPGILSFDWRS